MAIHWYNHFNKYKRLKFEEIKKRGFSFANLIAPSAVVRASTIGEGNWIEDLVCLEAHTIIGDNNIFRTGSLLSHNSIVGNHNVFVGKACIAGTCTIGDNNYLGINSLVFNDRTIGNNNIIGGGAILKQSLKDANIVTAPNSHCEQSTEKKLEFVLSPMGNLLTAMSNG